MKNYRDNGAIGAILDEYQKALNELIEVVKPLSEYQLKTIVDHDTDDESCRSIQTILSHVVTAGYTYVVETRKWLGESVDYKRTPLLENPIEYVNALNDMFKYNEQLFIDHPNIKLEEYLDSNKFRVRWGQSYDVEQIFEHAIVHILRHRRQIERFLIKLSA
jgi:hypothetical protein